MDVVEQVGYADSEDIEDGSNIAADKAPAIVDGAVGTAVGEAIILEVLGAVGSGSRRMPSVLTQ